jgi:predicted DNA-binding WGR domain protein
MNVFYKMQILLEKVREVYIVYTRWGRIGSSGQNQQTPFANLDDAVTEFKKIFKEKTSNEYTLDINSHFEKKNKKYQLIKQDMQRQDPQQFLKPFNWKIEPNPSSVSSILKIFADTKIYTNSFNFLHLNADFINMSTITPQQL